VNGTVRFDARMRIDQAAKAAPGPGNGRASADEIEID
jgi:hypothetical protein